MRTVSYTTDALTLAFCIGVLVGVALANGWIAAVIG